MAVKTDYWIAVASAEHVRRGRAQGFMQVSHGKEAPLKRVKPGDRVVYYSPTTVLGTKDGLQSFTAIGTVREGALSRRYGQLQALSARRRMGGSRGSADPAVARPLDFTAGRTNWGYQLRFGLFAISAKDFRLIAKAMQAMI